MSCHTIPIYSAPTRTPASARAWRTRDGILPDGNQPVDRLWVFWRKAATGAQSSTIYFATYRAGFDLVDLFKRNHVGVDPECHLSDHGCYRPCRTLGDRWRQDESVRDNRSAAAPSAAVIHYEWTDSNRTVQAATVNGRGLWMDTRTQGTVAAGICRGRQCQ